MNTPNTINDGGPAFPVPDSHYPNGQVQYGCNGMSLRAYFAGQALTGEVAALSSAESLKIAVRAAEMSNLSLEEHTAIQCVRYADALIEELNKTQQ